MVISQTIAKNTARKFSDLDLALEAPCPLSIQTLADLASDFEDFNLPYKVDLVDWRTASPAFKKIIATSRIDTCLN
jgi:predicted nucleotidyltransferase